MKVLNQRGSVGVWVLSVVIIGVFLAMFCINFKASNEVVSGIAYNVTNDHLFSGNTGFSIRAAEDTYVSRENESSYCLPPNSPYKALVNRAAADKRVKIVVESKKYFAVQLPWTCRANVTVSEVK